jgi:hypothetical protein
MAFDKKNNIWVTRPADRKLNGEAVECFRVYRPIQYTVRTSTII